VALEQLIKVMLVATEQPHQMSTQLLAAVVLAQ
jgi:hypothetical protein